MAIQQVGGVSGSVVEVGVGASIPEHVAAKPIPYGSLGHYRIARRIAPVASSTVNTNFLAFRNAGSNLAIITKLKIRFVQNAAPTAAVEARIGVFVARGYTVADGTGIGATPTLSGNNAKKRTAMGTTGVVITETSATGGLTGGTKTLDSDPLFQTALWCLAAVPTAGPSPDQSYEFEPDAASGASQLILAANEGLLFQWLTATAAAVGYAVYYEIAWAETTTY